MSLTNDNPYVEQNESDAQIPRIDMAAISRTILRVLAHLEKAEYTESRNERQADVVVHDDPPDPASDSNTTRG